MLLKCSRGYIPAVLCVKCSCFMCMALGNRECLVPGFIIKRKDHSFGIVEKQTLPSSEQINGML